LQVLPKRFAKFGLTLHPEKTRLIEFGRAAWVKGKRSGNKPETFNFLGLTHYCGTSLKGKFVVKVKTMSKRLKRGIKRVMARCKEIRHQPLDEQHRQLRMILFGHFAYYGRRTNFQSLQKFYRRVLTIWKKWLGRRGSGPISWEKLLKILGRYPLPKPRIVHGILGSRSQLSLFGEFN
jgi:hypothetical protein